MVTVWQEGEQRSTRRGEDEHSEVEEETGYTGGVALTTPVKTTSMRGLTSRVKMSSCVDEAGQADVNLKTRS